MSARCSSVKKRTAQKRAEPTEKNRRVSKRRRAGMGATVTSQADVQPIQETVTLPQTPNVLAVVSPQSVPVDYSLKKPKMSTTSSTQMPQKEPNVSKMCPVCHSKLKPVSRIDGVCNNELTECPNCPNTNPLCKRCLYPCPTRSCTNPWCQIVNLLLTCKQVTSTRSKVLGCPQFRACPKCHNLMMHSGGCKYVACTQCRHRYCFICLRNTDECKKDVDKYWSLTCSEPKAARQRFQT